MGVCRTTLGGPQALGPSWQPCLGAERPEPEADGWCVRERWGQRDRDLPLLAGIREMGLAHLGSRKPVRVWEAPPSQVQRSA